MKENIFKKEKTKPIPVSLYPSMIEKLDKVCKVHQVKRSAVIKKFIEQGLERLKNG